jgi:hypothetical protein
MRRVPGWYPQHMTGTDEARSDVEPTSMRQRRSRYFWSTVALAIAAMLLLCAALILIAATRS